MSGDPRLAFVGFGELASALATRVRATGATAPVAFTRPRSVPDEAEAVRARMRDAGVRPTETIAEAVASATVVLSCVPASAAADVAVAAARELRPDALYVDLASSAPEDKERAAEVVAAAGGRYVDAAVLGTVAASGGSVPILAAGDGASAFRDVATRLGLSLTAIEAPAGAAARIKLLRSVYMKGRDALVAEMVLAARAHGLENEVPRTIAGPGEEVPFPALVERILPSLAVHAGRRADELEAAAALVHAAGVDPAATAGAVRRLRLLAGLRETFAQARPGTASEVLEALERRRDG